MPRAFGVGQRNDAGNAPTQHYSLRCYNVFLRTATPPGPSFAGKDQAQLEEIDGSEALFTMYMERAEKEDKEMADRWKADADSILVFVSSLSKCTPQCSHRTVAEWPVLCNSCYGYWICLPGPQAKSPRHNEFLPCRHLPLGY